MRFFREHFEDRGTSRFCVLRRYTHHLPRLCGLFPPPRHSAQPRSLRYLLKSSRALAHRHEEISRFRLSERFIEQFRSFEQLNTRRCPFLSRGGNKSRKNRPRYRSPRTATAVSDARRTRQRERERERGTGIPFKNPSERNVLEFLAREIKIGCWKKAGYERRMRAVTPLRQETGNPGEKGGGRGEKKMEMGQQ